MTDLRIKLLLRYLYVTSTIKFSYLVIYLNTSMTGWFTKQTRRSRYNVSSAPPSGVTERKGGEAQVI